jgi:hypothetical protein
MDSESSEPNNTKTVPIEIVESPSPAPEATYYIATDAKDTNPGITDSTFDANEFLDPGPLTLNSMTQFTTTPQLLLWRVPIRHQQLRLRQAQSSPLLQASHRPCPRRPEQLHRVHMHLPIPRPERR